MKTKTETVYQVETRGFFSGQWMGLAAYKSLVRARQVMKDNAGKGASRGVRILKVTTITEFVEGTK